MFAVPPSPKSIAASSFDPASHPHTQHSHQHAHSALQLPKLEAPPSPTLLPLPHAHLLGPIQPPGDSTSRSMTARQHRQSAASSAANQRRRRGTSATQNQQRGMASPLPPPHPHPYAHGPIHTAPSFYASSGNGSAPQNRSHEPNALASATRPGLSKVPSSGPGPTRTPGGALYRRSAAAQGGHMSYTQAVKARVHSQGTSVVHAEGGAGGGASGGVGSRRGSGQASPNHLGEVELENGCTTAAAAAAATPPSASGGGSNSPALLPAPTAIGPAARHHHGMVSPPPNLSSPVHRLNSTTPTIPHDPSSLPAIHTAGLGDHSSAPSPNSSSASGMPSSPATQAPRLVPIPGHSGGNNAGPSGTSGPSSSTSIPTRRPPPSEAGSITDTDVTPTPSIAGTPSGSAHPDLPQIPIAFVLQRLHQLAGQFWSNPRSSDIRLIIPGPQKQPPNPTDDGRHSGVSSPNATPGPDTGTATNRFPEPSGSGAGSPSAQRVTGMSYALHRDYLVPQSSLLRTLLCDRLPPDAPELRGCRILPNTSLHGPRPVYVPLPDPESFGVLVHWMYWGDVSALENALNSGAVSWRGLVANIQYLGLDNRTKHVVGRWWRRWARAEERASHGFDADADTDDDDDWDEDDDYSPWGAAAAAAAGGPGSRPGNVGPTRAPVSRRRPGAPQGPPGVASGLSIAHPHGPGHSAHSHFTHARGGLDLLATASEREYDADEMSKRLGLL